MTKRALMDRIQYLHSIGDQGAAIDSAKALADDPDPEIRFGIGYLYFERSQNPSTMPVLAAEDLKMAMRLIQGAASDNLQQAASFISAAYEKGLYGVQKNNSLAVCWRSVAKREKEGRECH